ncbi:non-ribosomal peptide synthetase [Streptomyces sp. JB150]|uniref:non-ribosomal peptide synthetase n=1 Tax=Streptomyces sp. JB150 TaxID=2714844 RepID=UPI0014097D24|nr:non-ribosomal peptide synthetase [Streptomyces sp. JB150]QIJ66718.1 amino acid adenylation domain-containing protein [Streptomyces sp. JB150]
MTQRLAALPAERRASFLARLRQLAAAEPALVARGHTGPAPLSPAQESLRFLGRAVPGGPAAGAPLLLRLRGDLDRDALHSALAALVDRHEALRTTIVEHEDGPVQVVAAGVPVRLPLIEAEGEDHDRRLRAARELIARRIREPYDPSGTPAWRALLVRVAADDHLFLLDIPAPHCDTGSHGILVRDLAELYRCAREGGPARLPAVAVQYPDYALWERERRGADDLDRLTAYWRERLAGAETMEFPADRPRGETRGRAGDSRRFAVGRQALKRAADLARQEGVTTADVLTAAFFTLLHRYCGLADLVIGSPDTGRRHPALACTVGPFTELRVLRADLSGDPAFRTLVRRVAHESAEASAHGGLPFDRLVEAVEPVADPSRPPLFPIAFGVRDAEAVAGLPGLGTSLETVRTDVSHTDMSWALTCPPEPGSDGSLVVDFDSALFDAGSIDRFARHYDTLLHSLTADPDAPLSAAELLSPADLAFLAEVGTGPVRPVRESTVVREFEARVEEAPDSVAVVVAGVETGYAELNVRANRLAALLRGRGAGPGTRVGLCLRRTLDLPTAILAVLKTGAAYVPLDPASPAGRVAEIAADADVRVVVAHADAAQAVREVGAPVVTLDEVRAELAALPGHNPPLAAGPADVAYVIYTSGSTGKPKGVLLEHRGVVNFIDSTRELFELTPADRVLGFASATFDVSVFETFSALLTGARLYLATDEERLSVDRLQTLMERHGITVIDLPPTVMPLLAPEKFTDLRIAFVGGESFSGELVNRWNPGRRLFNGYGPTECTVTMIVEECPGSWETSPPIGLPMANHVAHVLDRELRPVPVGVPGELVIGGAGLARGYLNRDELTAQKFIADPFGTAPGGRLYRTGDLVKRLPDGRLVFLGRIDQQVKIRGLRIELGEVESALTGFSGIGPVSVQAWTDDKGAKHLVGYLTGVTEQQLPAVREHLRALLPSYMIPSWFVVLDELPVTSSGKVDRRRLPAPDPSRAGEEPGERRPLTATERRLLREVVAPLLGEGRIGVHDDFFLAGGNSLQAVQLMSAIKRRFGVEIALGDFFASPTVARLAAAVDTHRAARPAAGRAPVVMRASGPAQVILMHPSGGALFCYVPLVRALRESVSVSGFAADPDDSALPVREGLAASAARIAHHLLETGLPDTTCLAGWSYGGVLAFEVARQIEEKTGQRPPVVLLDSAYDEDSAPLDEATVRQRFVRDLARLTGRDPHRIEPEIDGGELAGSYRTFRFCALAMQEYRPPGPYGGPVTLLTASPRIAMEEQWRAVCTGPFRAENVPGDHYTLFTEPALSRVVAALEATLPS